LPSNHVFMHPNFPKDALLIPFSSLYLKYRGYIYKNKLAQGKPKAYLQALQIELIANALKENIRIFLFVLERRHTADLLAYWTWKTELREGYMKQIKVSPEVIKRYEQHKALKKHIHRYLFLLEKHHAALSDLFEPYA
jgi:hypothetical protein